MNLPRLDLLVPGLFGPPDLASEDPPSARALGRALGRADHVATASTDPLAVLFERFGIPIEPGLDLPSAPFSRLSDAALADPEGFWFHADPVHLRADRDRLLLFDSRPLGLARQEADALVALFNAHFGGEGLVLDAPVPERWYLRVAAPPRIKTQPLHAAVGRPIDSLLPKGGDAGRWNRLLNEVQMLFHQSDVNRRRDEQGSPMVNGIWVWGGGCLPQSAPRSDFVAVYARHPLALGLASASGVVAHPLAADPRCLTETLPEGNTLVFWDVLWPTVLDGDVAAWCRELKRLDAWFGTLVRAMGRMGFGRIDLYPCDGAVFRVDPAAMRRFWRRRLALGAGKTGWTRL